MRHLACHSGFAFYRVLLAVRRRVSLYAAVALLLPLAGTADDRIVTSESPPFALDTRPPAAAVVDPGLRMVGAESGPFTLDTRPPAAAVVDPGLRMVGAESGPFILDTRPPPIAVDPVSRMATAESNPFILDLRLPASVDPGLRMVVAESDPSSLDTRPDIGLWRNLFGFRIIGAGNEVVVVEVCTNLAHPAWYPLGTNALNARTFYFLDPTWTDYPHRFYRVRRP